MIVDNGRISWLGPAANLKAPAGAETINLAGKFVMPGIINLHSHLGNVVDLTQDRKYYTRENVQKDLNTYASYGVTTVLSMGTDQDLIFRIRDEQRSTGRPSMTRVYTAGQGFAFKGGYGGLPGVTFSLQDTSEVEKDVAELAKKKVDIVKMWVDDHLGHMKKMPFEISKAIVDSAHQHGLPAAAHIFYLDDAKKLAAAGVNGFAHSVRDKPVDQELIDLMKKRGTWLAAATLTREASTFVYAKAPSFLNDPFFTRSVSPKALATLKSAEYQKSIADDPDFPKLPGIARNGQEESEAPIGRRREVRIRNRRRPARKIPRLFRTVGNGVDGRSRFNTEPGDTSRDQERRRIPGRERPGHTRARQVGRPDSTNRRPAKEHPQHSQDSIRLHRRQSRCGTCFSLFVKK